MMNTSIERNAKRANSQPETEFTTLMHHYSVDNLRDCYASLASQSAVGVDGESKAADGEHLEDNLRELHRKRRERSYRPQPLRRVEIPKPDGTLRPLGISGVADKIVQEMTRRILAALYEPAFLDPSDGFRPAKSCHDGLRQLNQEVMSQPVNWIVDLDHTLQRDFVLALINEPYPEPVL
jgi:RNA-directed DNA polymerase